MVKGKNVGKRKKIDFGMDSIGKAPLEKIIDAKLIELEPAPLEWNFYKPLTDNKLTELLESIEKNGLLVPIIIWEREVKSMGTRYMILSGHNRVKAYKIMKEVTGDNKYDTISAIVKRRDEITDNEAREIIIDTNWVQRTLSPMEKAKSILEKYTVLESRSEYDSNYNKYGKGRARDAIGKQFQLSGRTVERYRNLNFLINDLNNLVNEGRLSITLASKISVLNRDIQLWLFNNHKNKLSSKYIDKIKKHMTISEINDIFIEISKTDKIETIKVKIPKKTYTNYNNLSSKEKMSLDNEIIKLIDNYKV